MVAVGGLQVDGWWGGRGGGRNLALRQNDTEPFITFLSIVELHNIDFRIFLIQFRRYVSIQKLNK